MRCAITVLCISLLTLGLCACYHPDIDQGNDYSSASAQKLKLGMDKTTVIQLMGQPLLNNPFSKDQLTYVYYRYPNRGKTVHRHLTLSFKDNHLSAIQQTES